MTKPKCGWGGGGQGCQGRVTAERKRKKEQGSSWNFFPPCRPSQKLWAWSGKGGQRKEGERKWRCGRTETRKVTGVCGEDRPLSGAGQGNLRNDSVQAAATLWPPNPPISCCLNLGGSPTFSSEGHKPSPQTPALKPTSLRLPWVGSRSYGA